MQKSNFYFINSFLSIVKIRVRCLFVVERRDRVRGRTTEHFKKKKSSSEQLALSLSDRSLSNIRQMLFPFRKLTEVCFRYLL